MASGLSDIITLTTPGIVADSNGFFHPLGDHAQMSLSVDNQPITDQQGNIYSTQLPLTLFRPLKSLLELSRRSSATKLLSWSMRLLVPGWADQRTAV